VVVARREMIPKGSQLHHEQGRATKRALASKTY
jgi:hypothetical protein